MRTRRAPTAELHLQSTDSLFTGWLPPINFGLTQTHLSDSGHLRSSQIHAAEVSTFVAVLEASASRQILGY